jgi:hypothetical protein
MKQKDVVIIIQNLTAKAFDYGFSYLNNNFENGKK